MPVTGIILSRTLSKALDLNKNLVLYIQFNLVDKSFADVFWQSFFLFFVLLEIAKAQVLFKMFTVLRGKDFISQIGVIKQILLIVVIFFEIPTE